MIPRLALLLTLSSNAVVAATQFSTFSKAGNNLISKSRRLDEEYDLSWVTDYSIKFEGCHNIIQFEGGGGEEEEGKVRTQNIARFKLCPSNTCSSSCAKGGEYLSEMERFLENYIEFKAEELEYNCEYVQENCDCENANDDEACEQQCYIDAGLEDCIEVENDDDGEEFDLADYLDCKEIQENGDDDGQGYYVGPKCSSNGKSVFLGVYTNERCTTEAENGEEIYKSIIGKSLPYATTSIIKHECISCKQVNDDDDDDDIEVSEMCDEVYEEAAKCEKNMEIDYPHTQDCEFVHSTIKRLDSSFKGPVVAHVFGWIFLLTTIGLGYYAYTLHTKLQRKDVKLNESVGEMA